MNLLFFDVETTGLDPQYHEIIDICLVETDRRGTEIKRYSSLIVPLDLSKASAEALQVNGYSEEKWKENHAVEYIIAMDEIYNKWYNDCTQKEQRKKLIPIGWNIPFDISFIKQHFSQLYRRFHHHSLDLMSLYWPLLIEIERPSLKKMWEVWTGQKELPRAHTAEGDVETCLTMYREGIAHWSQYMEDLPHGRS